MNRESFIENLPGIQEFKPLTSEKVHLLLLRASSFLEAVEGLKANPEISARMNLNELRLLQTMLKVSYSLQLRVFELEEQVSHFAGVQNENNQLHDSLAHAVHVRGDLEDELRKLKEQNEKESVRYLRDNGDVSVRASPIEKNDA